MCIRDRANAKTRKKKKSKKHEKKSEKKSKKSSRHEKEPSKEKGRQQTEPRKPDPETRKRSLPVSIDEGCTEPPSAKRKLQKMKPVPNPEPKLKPGPKPRLKPGPKPKLKQPAHSDTCPLWQLRQLIEHASSAGGLEDSMGSLRWSHSVQWEPSQLLQWLEGHVASLWRDDSFEQLSERLCQPQWMGTMSSIAAHAAQASQCRSGLARISFMEMLAQHMSDAVMSKMGKAHRLDELVALSTLLGSITKLMGDDGVRRIQVFLHQVLVHCFLTAAQNARKLIALSVAKTCPLAFGGCDLNGRSHHTVLSRVTRHVLRCSGDHTDLLSLLPPAVHGVDGLGAEDTVLQHVFDHLKTGGKVLQPRTQASVRFCAALGCELLTAYHGADWGVTQLLQQHVWPLMTDAVPEVMMEAVRVMGFVVALAAEQGNSEVVAQISEILSLAISSCEQGRLPFAAEVAAVEALLEVSYADPVRGKVLTGWFSGLSAEQIQLLNPRIELNLQLLSRLH
eukprot:TRINITY_DN46106_c0_g2_i1.p1 TRINITY_DN46106_c0_g2~~TRINITY_DN46106_c0_g2_i1.p1  ORF type:complete len:506 (+),score=83.18 TRINITY_DN46106_c0_g2_i1:93-1610(+)